MNRNLLGFTGSAWWRLLFVAFYAFIVCAMIILVERGFARNDEAIPKPASNAPSQSVRLEIEATFPVEEWLVLADGNPISGEHDQTKWTTDAEILAAEFFIEAHSSDYFAENSESMRARIYGHDHLLREETWWGNGTATMMLKVQQP